MVVEHLELRDFRNLDRATAELGPGITIVHGPNGCGKTNLLEGLCFGLTGHSPRTTRERDLIRFDHPVARSEATVAGPSGTHVWSSAIERGGGRQRQLDGARLDRGGALSAEVPRLSVFLPDRLELIKGSPGLRRDHLDRLVADLWPARAECRKRYGAALGQRNALLSRIRSGEASAVSLAAWNEELAERGLALMESRQDALSALHAGLARAALGLGLPGPVSLVYRPRSPAGTAAELAAELAARREQDLARGFTGHGPHRDELDFEIDGRSLRRFGSQGQQRATLLGLLLAEREAVEVAGGTAPILLLDDVLSELDREHRLLLLEEVAGPGQALVTATELSAAPEGPDIHSLAMGGREGAAAALAA